MYVGFDESCGRFIGETKSVSVVVSVVVLISTFRIRLLPVSQIYIVSPLSFIASPFGISNNEDVASLSPEIVGPAIKLPAILPPVEVAKL